MVEGTNTAMRRKNTLTNPTSRLVLPARRTASDVACSLSEGGE